ncbi:hypothetical protein D3C78_1775310 [compost metagenome]
MGGVFRQRVLTEQGSGDVRQAQAGVVGEILPRQIFACLGVENAGGQGQAGVVVGVGLLHGVTPFRGWLAVWD